MIFDLADDFQDALTEMPEEHPKRGILKLLNEAIRRDIHFIAIRASDYPQGLFQCFWNTCWWYDCDQLERYGDAAKSGRENVSPPWRRGSKKLSEWMRDWGNHKRHSSMALRWRPLVERYYPLGIPIDLRAKRRNQYNFQLQWNI